MKERRSDLLIAAAVVFALYLLSRPKPAPTP